MNLYVDESEAGSASHNNNKVKYGLRREKLGFEPSSALLDVID
jgi:hypothetical protein